MEEHAFPLQSLKESSMSGSDEQKEGRASECTGPSISNLAVLFLMQINKMSFWKVHHHS